MAAGGIADVVDIIYKTFTFSRVFIVTLDVDPISPGIVWIRLGGANRAGGTKTGLDKASKLLIICHSISNKVPVAAGAFQLERRKGGVDPATIGIRAATGRIDVFAKKLELESGDNIGSIGVINNSNGDDGIFAVVGIVIPGATRFMADGVLGDLERKTQTVVGVEIPGVIKRNQFGGGFGGRRRGG